MDTQTKETSILLPIGTKLNGKYTIIKHLTSRQFCNIYIANNSKLRENVLIKELFIKNISQRANDSLLIEVDNKFDKIYSDYLDKFNEEARCLRQINNPHVIHIVDLFSENNTCYYVMDYVEGEFLSNKMTRRNDVFSESETISYLTQMLDGLNSMHTQGVWHLDITPSNTIVDNNGQIIFMEFGHCKLVDNESTIISTTNHDPIELQSLDTNNIGPWTDFFQLGATLYNVLSGKIPPSSSDINEVTTSLYKFPTNVSKKTQRLILWMMTPNIFRRPQDIGEIKDFLYGTQAISQQQNENSNKDSRKSKIKKTDDEDSDGLGNKTLKAMQIFIFLSVLLLLGFLAYKFFYNEEKEEQEEKNSVNLVKEKPEENLNSQVSDKPESGNNTISLADSINKTKENNTSESLSDERNDKEADNNIKTEDILPEITDNNNNVLTTSESVNQDKNTASENASSQSEKPQTEDVPKPKVETNQTQNSNAPSDQKQSVQTTSESNPQKFNVVVGSFGTKENADVRVNELKSKGFNATVKYMDSNKMYRVIITNVDEHTKNRIKESYVDAWSE